MIVLRPPFSSIWKNKDPFEEVKKITGKTYRSVKSRRTIRFEVNGEGYYLKLHHGTSYGEAFKNFLCLRLPVFGAKNEWLAINKLAEFGIDTMTGVAFGEKGKNPFHKTSFIITKEIAPSISLEDFCKDWKEKPPSFDTKRSLIKRVATAVRKMHMAGINHRDCYLCHFLLSLPFDLDNAKLSLIDLHRAQIRKTVPKRWRDKDIIALYYSSLEIGLTRTDIVFFLKNYLNENNIHKIFSIERKLIASTASKAKKIAERTKRKGL